MWLHQKQNGLWWTDRWAAVCAERWWQGSAGMFVRKRWNGGDARCAWPTSLRASAAKKLWNARCIGRGRPSRTVLGKSIPVDQIDALDDAKIVKLYARYEARLGAAMTRTLGSAELLIYAGVASMFFQSKTSQPLLLISKPTRLSGKKLSSATCELYHRMACSWHR